MFEIFGPFLKKYLKIMSDISINDNNTSLEKNGDNNNDIKNQYESVSSARILKMTITRDEVQQLIESNKVIIFSKSTCPYCKMAKEVFNKLNEKYTVIELDKRDDQSEFQNILEEITGARTVPRVFLNGECLGGGTDIKKLYDNGELVKKL